MASLRVMGLVSFKMENRKPEPARGKRWGPCLLALFVLIPVGFWGCGWQSYRNRKPYSFAYR